MPKGLNGQVLAEAEVDSFGHVRLGGVGQYVANQLSKMMQMPVRVTNLAYLQRGGTPSPFDRILATFRSNPRHEIWGRGCRVRSPGEL